jgi:hypothetical protein
VARLTSAAIFDHRPQLGHGKIKVLAMIALYGRISAAGRAMQTSYRRAWLLVEDAACTFATPLPVKQLSRWTRQRQDVGSELSSSIGRSNGSRLQDALGEFYNGCSSLGNIRYNIIYAAAPNSPLH